MLAHMMRKEPRSLIGNVELESLLILLMRGGKEGGRGREADMLLTVGSFTCKAARRRKQNIWVHLARIVAGRLARIMNEIDNNKVLLSSLSEDCIFW